MPATTRTPLNRQQILGFWAAWAGWTLDGMDSVIYALVLAPALTDVMSGQLSFTFGTQLALEGPLKTGRVLDYLNRGDENRKICSLHLSLMDKMGVPVERLGASTGKLDIDTLAGI